jgi:hypothetical protein
MRYLLVFLLASTFADHTFGQSKSSSPAAKTAPAVTKVAPAGYRMTRTDGNVYLLKSYKQDGRFYTVTDINGKVTTHLIESVLSIRELSEEKLDEAVATYEPPGVSARASSSTRTSARTSSRSKARTTARIPDPVPVPKPDPPPSSYTSADSSSLGSTATGIPLHMGPRGGIYHYSKNGNKVYQRKK